MTGMGAADMISHLSAGCVVLVATFGLFARGIIGGGDAKLASAAALWLGFDHLLPYLLFASLLGGALSATMSNRVQKLFGAGSVKVDPNYLGVLGNSTTRITVVEQVGKVLTLTYATDVDTTAQQLLQAEIAINRHVSLMVARDESGVFSMVVKATRRYK